jgi:hypothetical protein
MPWESAQDFAGRALAAYPTVHPVVEQVRARGVSRPVELLDADDVTFVLAVCEAWAVQVGEDQPAAGDHRASRRTSRRHVDRLLVVERGHEPVDDPPARHAPHILASALDIQHRRIAGRPGKD